MREQQGCGAIRGLMHTVLWGRAKPSRRGGRRTKRHGIYKLVQSGSELSIEERTGNFRGPGVCFR
ncbi:hypothetical protein GCWU000341_01553 [Oribacterium sp. oral taxon 078 str. F0262]|nr:hypothetical protein GCWU000341_01553 [Oribacterium sp. oral taxon 078 str. F0262]